MSLFQALIREEELVVHTLRLNTPAVACVMCGGLGILQNDAHRAYGIAGLSVCVCVCASLRLAECQGEIWHSTPSHPFF